MRKFIKPLILAGVVVALIMGAFFFYSHFLVDYSLENLETALKVAKSEEGAAQDTLLERQALGGLLSDIVVEEVSKEQADLTSVTYLEMASRAAENSYDVEGLERAAAYLSQVREKKMADRHPLLRAADLAYRKVKSINQSITAAVRHFRGKSGKDKKAPGLQYSGFRFLEEARESESRKDYPRAILLYQEYLDHYPTIYDRGTVLIALGQAYKKAKNLDDARRIFQQVILDYGGRREADIAEGLLKQMNRLANQGKMVAQLQDTIGQGANVDESQRFKLALGYLSTYDLTSAQKILSELSRSADADVAKRATFYLSWIMKMNSQYDKSTEALMNLLEKPDLEKSFNLALRAQLADIYFKQNRFDDSAKEYQKIMSEKTTTDFSASGQTAAERAWISLAEIENSKLYEFSVDSSEEYLPEPDRPSGFASRIEQSGQRPIEVNYRQKAMKALAQRQVREAYDLLKKSLAQNPSDAWSYSAMSTVSILFESPSEALEYAQKGYTANADEYTTSVLAYVYGIFGRYEEAIQLYAAAEQMNPEYFPASFNKGVMLLRAGRPQEGLNLFTELYRKAQRSENIVKAKILNNLGYALAQLGVLDQAKERFDQALKLMPTYRLAAINLSRLKSTK